MSSHISIIETTSIKCILLNKKLPNELVSIIIEFSFQDLYKAKKIHQDNFINVRNQIDSCNYWNLQFTSNDNDESENWHFEIIDINPRFYPLLLQAANCKKCGQYRFSYTGSALYLSKSIGCCCPVHIKYLHLLAFESD
jgi:hypothetical protein